MKNIKLNRNKFKNIMTIKYLWPLGMAKGTVLYHRELKPRLRPIIQKDILLFLFGSIFLNKKKYLSKDL